MRHEKKFCRWGGGKGGGSSLQVNNSSLIPPGLGSQPKTILLCTPLPLFFSIYLRLSLLFCFSLTSIGRPSPPSITSDFFPYIILLQTLLSSLLHHDNHHPSCLDVPLPCCLVGQLLSYQAAQLPGQLTFQLINYLVVELPSCLAYYCICVVLVGGCISLLTCLARRAWRGRRNSSGGGRQSKRGWANTPTLSKLGQKYHHPEYT